MSYERQQGERIFIVLYRGELWNRLTYSAFIILFVKTRCKNEYTENVYSCAGKLLNLYQRSKLKHSLFRASHSEKFAVEFLKIQ